MSGGSYNYVYCTLSNECENAMYDEEMNDLIKDLCEVLHDLEWWQSGDYGEVDYRKTVKRFKEKWFIQNREDRLKIYIDNKVGKTQKELYNLIGIEKEEKCNLYKANYMQNPCNILTEENLNRLEEHCKKAIHYERGEIKREHEVTLNLLYKYKDQQAESEKKDKIIGKMIDNIMTHYQVKTIRKMCCPTCIIGEKACTYSGIHRNCIKQYFERKVVNGEE